LTTPTKTRDFSRDSTKKTAISPTNNGDVIIEPHKMGRVAKKWGFNKEEWRVDKHKRQSYQQIYRWGFLQQKQGCMGMFMANNDHDSPQNPAVPAPLERIIFRSNIEQGSFWDGSWTSLGALWLHAFSPSKTALHLMV
jgi:hypothetical protein